MDIIKEHGTDPAALALRLEGDCDLYSAPAFAKEALALVAGGERRLLVDFAKVGYLDSTGVGAIIRLVQAAKAASCELAFRGIRGNPRKVLEMSNVLLIMKEVDRPAGGR